MQYDVMRCDGLLRYKLSRCCCVRRCGSGSKKVYYAPGLPTLDSTDTAGFSAAAAAVGRASATLVLLGLCESGHGCTEHENLDRTSLGLPPTQLKLLELVAAASKQKAAGATPTICAFVSGGPLSVDRLDELCTATIWLSYPGQAGMEALVDVILGTAAPRCASIEPSAVCRVLFIIDSGSPCT
jgi:hypothetical protein